jgi:hypothetical protein
MAKPRDQSATFNWENRLERKLSVYAVASGAFLAASAAGSARAGIIYSPQTNVPIQNLYGGGTATYFSFTGSATPDVTLGAASGADLPGTGSFLVASTGQGVSLVSGGYSPIDSGVPFGSMLGSFTTISGTSTFGATNSGYKLGKNKTGAPVLGDWAYGGIGFLGVSFQLDGQTHYGWIELAINPSTLTGTLIEGAYESDPNTPIITPQAIPEPSSLGLGLLALGAVGVGALHRSRKKGLAASSAA